jgi:ribosomal protein S4
MKQIARKFIQPFYGNLSLKQTKKLIKKAKKIKSSRVSQSEVILHHLESRLDVVIYRLNLAPNIL